LKRGGRPAAGSGKKTGRLKAAIDLAPGIGLYQITRSGLAIRAVIQGTKKWKDDELNQE
jgi:hypothetical protein